MAVSDLEYVTSKGFESGTGESVLNVVFLGFHDEGNASLRAPEEVAGVTWRTPESIRNDEAVPEYTWSYVTAARRRRRRSRHPQS